MFLSIPATPKPSPKALSQPIPTPGCPPGAPGRTWWSNMSSRVHFTLTSPGRFTWKPSVSWVVGIRCHCQGQGDTAQAGPWNQPCQLGWGSGQGLAQPHSLGHPRQLLVPVVAAQSCPSPSQPRLCPSTGTDWGNASPECSGCRAPTAAGSILQECAPELLQPPLGGGSASPQSLPGQKQELGAGRAPGRSTQKSSDPSPRHGFNPSRTFQLRDRQEGKPFLPQGPGESLCGVSTPWGPSCASLGDSCPWGHVPVPTHLSPSPGSELSSARAKGHPQT